MNKGIIYLKIFFGYTGAMWYLSSPTRYQTHAPCSGSAGVLTPGLPGLNC